MITPELLNAIKERIRLGYSKADITNELTTAGYDIGTIEQVYAQATAEETAAAAPQVMQTPETPSAGYDQSAFSTQAFPEQPAGRTGGARLESFGELLEGGFQFALRQKDIMLLLSAIYILFPLVEVGANSYQISRDYRSMMEFALLPVMLFAIVTFIIGNFAAIYICAQPKGVEATIKESRGFLASNLLGLFVLSIMTGLAVMGGFILFFIPMVYLLFVYFVYVREGKKYLQAMLRSHQIISGHWWAVALRALGLGLSLFLVAVLVGLGIGLASSQLPSLWGEVISTVASGVLAIFYTLVSVHAYGSMFNTLLAQAPSPDTPPKSSLKIVYIILMALGPIAYMALMYMIAMLFMLLLFGGAMAF